MESAFGLFILESLAAGRPVVVPRRGAFPELLAQTGGGLLFDDLSAAALADRLTECLHPTYPLAATGAAGQTAVLNRFTVDRMARELVTLTGATRS